MNWNLLKESILLQPLPEPDICVGDILKTTVFGDTSFNIDEIINNSGILTYKASLLDNKYFIAYFNRESLIKDLKRIDIFCMIVKVNLTHYSII